MFHRSRYAAAGCLSRHHSHALHGFRCFVCGESLYILRERSMNFSSLETSRTFLQSSRGRMRLLLALVLGIIWYLGNGGGVGEKKMRLWIYEWKLGNGRWSPSEADLWRVGFIGVKWRVIITTLGLLETKRTGCDSLWVARVLLEFRKIAIFRKRIPVFHFFNLWSLVAEIGAPYDGVPVPRFRQRHGLETYLVGMTVFFPFLLSRKRWRMDEP